jgi:hypothetical protein
MFCRLRYREGPQARGGFIGGQAQTFVASFVCSQSRFTPIIRVDLRAAFSSAFRITMSEDRAFRTGFLAEHLKQPKFLPQMTQIHADMESKPAYRNPGGSHPNH